MYNDNNVGLEFYNLYFRFVDLFKEKGKTADKFDKLNELLKCTLDKFDSLNEDERKLVKNIIPMASGLLSYPSLYKGKNKEKIDQAKSYIEELKEKQKEPTK